MRWALTTARTATIIRAHPRMVVGAAVLTVVAGAAGGWRWARGRAARTGEPRLQLVEGPAPRPARPIGFEEGCSSARCHASIADGPITHAPTAKGECQACHAPDAGGHVYPLLAPKAQLCAPCHDTGSHHRFQHKAMSDEACLACHDPHASPTAGLLTAPSLAQTCAGCHPESQGTVRHKPFASRRCDACHDPHGADNAALLLAGTGADACRTCHADVATAIEKSPHSHRDVEGACQACHAPHAADHKALLDAPTREVCVRCHTEIGRAVAVATVSHDPVLKDHQCVTCHDPHASENPRILRDTQAQVCLSCHDSPMVGQDGRKIAGLGASLAHSPVVHGAVRLGDCAACHSVHGGASPRLLHTPVAPGPLAPHDARLTALCFACHDRDLAGAGGGTLFRDGDTNLHELHLRSGDRQRSCAACHAIHAGDEPRLIARTVNFEGSGWEMPIGFELLADGGRCGPGCHEPLEYRRGPGGARAGAKATGNVKGGAP